MDLEPLWEYSDPAASEVRFRDALAGAQGELRLEIATQIARTYSLRKRFDEAHRQLDEIAPHVATAGPRLRARYLLERGRTFNSAGDKKKARTLFVEAFETASAAREEGLAVDAAHMVAIAESGTPSAIEWNRRGLELARGSRDAKAKALVPALLNNQAWDLHAMGRFDEAHALFREALQAWSERGRPRQVQIAKWSIARCLRSMGRLEEALAMQRGLEAELSAAGATDRYVLEEIAHLLEALGKPDEARSYRDKAKAAP